MTDSDSNSMNDQLSKPTPIFGLRLWVVMGISLGAAIVIVFFVLSLWLISKRAAATTSSAETKQPQESQRPTIPTVTKSIPEIKIGDSNQTQSDPVSESGRVDGIERQALIEKQEEGNPGGFNKVQVEMVKGLKILCQDKFSGSGSSGRGEVRGGDQGPEVSHLGWGHWYTLRELEVATNGFCDQNVIGEGGYGIVYYGCLEDNTQVAVKNLLNNKGQAEKEFKVEVEAIGRVRHKGLVRLLGYCAEGAQRMLVYEYVNNGNLEQWLHGEVGPCSPLTWEIRMNIILGAAKGLTYLHEGLEPKVVHRDIKSSNILLDRQWNPKVSDFGLAKLLGSQKSYVTTRVMGTFGYVAPEYASSGMLTERSDVYSFGILVMEILSGRNPVDYNRPPGEVKLVDWLKLMVASKNPEGVLDPKLPEKPSSRELKRALLIALRCVDPNADKRPKMGQIVHMLEADESSYKDVRKSGRNLEKAHLDGLKEDSGEKS